MNERLLQYIWQFKYFNQQELATTAGETLSIIQTGDWNTHQGPDFQNARIVLGSTQWVGDVELHLLASDWNRHGHQADERYNKIILHVVWKEDIQLQDQQGYPIPTLELHNRVSNMMLDKYAQWMHSRDVIPCNEQINKIHSLVWQQWTDRLLVERLEQKMLHIQTLLKTTENHWEEVFWRLICRYFGGKTNGQSFEQIAESLSINIIARHKQNLIQLESLLLGQAGLLHKGFTEDYPAMLYREYQFLQKKYSLRVINKPPVFLRMRPVNFPSIRLAQLAALLSQSHQLLSHILTLNETKSLYQLLDVTANDYWHYHFKFDQPGEYQPKHLGKQMMDTIIINAVIPVLFAYGKHLGKQEITDKALTWLTDLAAEKNALLAPFQTSGMAIENAGQSQAAIQLRLQYCDARRCLECSIGNALLKKS